MLGVSRCCVFWGFLNSLCGIFTANSNPLSISVVVYPLWCRVVCSSLRRVFFRFISVIIVCILRARV